MDKFANLRIVVPIDFSEEAERALNFALGIATRPSDIRAIHVARPLIYVVISDEARSEHIQAEFQKRHADLKYADIHFDVRLGDPGGEIVRFADEIKAGLIVMPSLGRTGLKHLLIGSVAERVVRLATCPVLVLRA